MKKLIFLLMMGVGISSYTFSAGVYDGDNGTDNCIVTTDLMVQAGSLDFGKKLGILKGKLHNSSEAINYANVKLRINYFDYLGNPLGFETTVIERDLKSGETDMFVEHLKPPKNTDHVTCDVVCAEQKE